MVLLWQCVDGAVGCVGVAAYVVVVVCVGIAICVMVLCVFCGWQWPAWRARVRVDGAVGCVDVAVCAVVVVCVGVRVDGAVGCVCLLYTSPSPRD